MILTRKNLILHDSWQSANPKHSHAPPILSSVQSRETRIDSNRQKTVSLLQAEQQVVLPFCENQRIARLPRKNDSTDFSVELFR
jgi:hypothetical protein